MRARLMTIIYADMLTAHKYLYIVTTTTTTATTIYIIIIGRNQIKTRTYTIDVL